MSDVDVVKIFLVYLIDVNVTWVTVMVVT